MTTLTIRVSDSLVRDIDMIAQEYHAKRAEVIRQALASMVHENLKSRERAKLIRLSQRVREESMRINEEFSPADYEFEHETR